MIKHFCDLCEKQLKTPFINKVDVSRQGGYRLRMLMCCDECFEKLGLPETVLPYPEDHESRRK
jgi:hypothetical protein